MISYGKQSIDQSDIDVIIESLKSDWLTQGPKTEEFESDLGMFFGTKYTCAVSSGTAALHLTGLALGWKPKDIVITSPLTFLASSNCIIYTGAVPDFADICIDSYTIDPNLVEKKVKFYRERGKSIKAIIAVDYAGHPCDWTALRSIADKYNLKLVNDNCHAFGARYNGDIKYAAKYADVVTQSFHPVKHITTGEGGAILTNDKSLYEKVSLLRTHGMTKNPSLLSQKQGSWYYEMVDLGYNYRLTDFQSALGINQLKKISGFNKLRKKIAKKYDDSFSKDDRFIIPSRKKNIEHAYHLYPLQIKFNKFNLSREELFIELDKKKIRLQVHYIPVHLQPYYSKNYDFNKGDFPISENFYDKEISLPIYPALNVSDQEMVIHSILKILNE